MKKYQYLLIAVGAFIGWGIASTSAFAALSPVGGNVTIDNTIYFITADGQRRPYLSDQIFLSYGYNH